MTSLRAVLVDDEAPALRELARELERVEGVTVVGQARDLPTATGLVLRTGPDVVFLDIALGNESGFELLPELDEGIAVIFVTAYGDHAVRAFEDSALDYLLKPVDPARLAASVDRVRHFVANRERMAGEGARRPFNGGRWLFVDGPGGAGFIEIEAIARIDADAGGSRIRTVPGATLPTSISLVEWMRRLPGDFRRVHRSTIVNLAHVERVESWSHYSYRLHLRGEHEPVRMSRRYAARLRSDLG